jgi:hypothetical protein
MSVPWQSVREAHHRPPLEAKLLVGALPLCIFAYGVARTLQPIMKRSVLEHKETAPILDATGAAAASAHSCAAVSMLVSPILSPAIVRVSTDSYLFCNA